MSLAQQVGGRRDENGAPAHRQAPPRARVARAPRQLSSTPLNPSLSSPRPPAAALYKAQYPTATAAEVRAALLNSVAPTTSLSAGATSTGGRLDCGKLLTLVPPAPCTATCTTGQYCTGATCSPCPVNW